MKTALLLKMVTRLIISVILPWWLSVYNACVVPKQRHYSRPKRCDSFGQRHGLILDAGRKNGTSGDRTVAMVSAMDYS